MNSTFPKNLSNYQEYQKEVLELVKDERVIPTLNTVVSRAQELLSVFDSIEFSVKHSYFRENDPKTWRFHGDIPGVGDLQLGLWHFSFLLKRGQFVPNILQEQGWGLLLFCDYEKLGKRLDWSVNFSHPVNITWQTKSDIELHTRFWGVPRSTPENKFFETVCSAIGKKPDYLREGMKAQSGKTYPTLVRVPAPF